MKIMKWVCGILLLLFGVALVFVGAVGSWESLTSGELMGLVLLLPLTVVGVGLIWLGVRILRSRPGKKAQEHVLLEQEKASRKETQEEAWRKAREEARRKAMREAKEQAQQEKERWMAEHPAQKAQFAYLHTMLSREVLCFYDPSGKEYGGMDSSRNHTGGEWMRTLPVYDLERVVEFYQELWAAKDHLSQEELRYASYKLDCSLEALTHRRLYLRLNGEGQLTALGDRKETLLERCREQDIHLILQPSRSEIMDLTDGMAYAIHTEEMGRSPLTDEVVGGAVTLVPVKIPSFCSEEEEQLECNVNGKEVLMLNLGDGYYQSPDSGEFYKFERVTWPGSADDADTYEECHWNRVEPLPTRPPQP